MFYRYGSGCPNVCIICEYDALPKIGHACGHNLIAEAGVAAGLRVKAFIESQTSQTGFSGTVTVMGTPAEESVGGKIILIERGGFDDIDIAVMAHPTPSNIAMPKFICMSPFVVTFNGKAAHAAAHPWQGVNALDAAVLAYTNISVLRQQMKPSWRVHAIFTDGGVKPNIIPQTASLKCCVRAETLAEVNLLKEKVYSCFRGAAESTGCKCVIDERGFSYRELNSNKVLAKLYYDHMLSLGVTGIEWVGDVPGSTDMGNVSHVLPSIHPVYKISDEGIHTRLFQKASNTLEAHKKTLLVAEGLSLTCIDVLMGGEELLTKIKNSMSQH